MIKKLLALAALGVLLSGCILVAPLALVGPVTSGFNTASLIQTGLTQSASYVVKKSTGKSISQHAYDAISKDIMQQTYLPRNVNPTIKVAP